MKDWFKEVCKAIKLILKCVVLVVSIFGVAFLLKTVPVFVAELTGSAFAGALTAAVMVVLFASLLIGTISHAVNKQSDIENKKRVVVAPLRPFLPPKSSPKIPRKIKND